MDPLPSSSFPLSLTQAELDAFNKFWRGLSSIERQALDELIQAAQERFVHEHPGQYFPYHALLLSILIEQHREIKQLRQILEKLK